MIIRRKRAQHKPTNTLHGTAPQLKRGMLDLEKANVLSAYIFSTMRCDKTGSGWRHGDTLWACDAKHGNRTDFIPCLYPWFARRRSRPG